MTLLCVLEQCHVTLLCVLEQCRELLSVPAHMSCAPLSSIGTVELCQLCHAQLSLGPVTCDGTVLARNACHRTHARGKASHPLLPTLLHLSSQSQSPWPNPITKPGR